MYGFDTHQQYSMIDEIHIHFAESIEGTFSMGVGSEPTVS